jgi:curved DNA-binding protein CbpA
MTIDKTLYEILNINSDVQANEIKASFRKLALIYHPDKNNNSYESQLRFQIIYNAYKILSDANARIAYDNYLKTSTVIKNQSKNKTKNSLDDAADSLEYFHRGLNFILWEIEDILSLIKAGNDDRAVGGKSVKEWLLEILIFIDKWILEPGGFPDYFYEARRIDKIKHSERFIDKKSAGLHKAYVSLEDYFYEIRKRMSRFIENIKLQEMMKTIEGYDIRIIDTIIEALRMSYHYLGNINSILKGENISIKKFIHSNTVYEEYPVKLIDK